MKIRAIITTITLCFNTISYGETCAKVSLLNKGDTAACKGFLFSLEKEQEVRRIHQEYFLLKEELSLQQQELQKYKELIQNVEILMEKEQKKTEVWRIRAEDLTEKYTKTIDSRTTNDILFFCLGIGLTIGSAFVLKQTLR